MLQILWLTLLPVRVAAAALCCSTSPKWLEISLQSRSRLVCPQLGRADQGPLKKWTEHSQELHLMKIHSRGAPITPQGWMGVDFLDHELL